MHILWVLLVVFGYWRGYVYGRRSITNAQFRNPEWWIVELQKRAGYYKEMGI